jgi:hypothetical protein
MTADDISVELYSPQKQREWDAFIEKSKNAHFMHQRNYMDYHADRFKDCSLILRSVEKGVVAVFPANIADGIVYSHQGLSFGGVLVGKRATMVSVAQYFDAISSYLKKNYKVSKVIYKRVPDFYNTFPSQEDLYALFRIGAKVIHRDISSLIKLDSRLGYTRGRKWSINKAKKAGVVVSEVTQIECFWDLVTSVLHERHDVKPVHNVQEIALLMHKFPHRIRCFVAQHPDSTLLAGTLIYETDLVAHTQYLANSALGRKVGALDYLLDVLISFIYKDKAYFDFGISTKNNGLILNEGLITQKESFGARGVVYDCYKWDL